MTLDDGAKRRLVARGGAGNERAIVVRVEGHIRIRRSMGRAHFTDSKKRCHPERSEGSRY